MTIITRFAPSPTGMLHVGNIRTALHNWMFAQKQGGKFLLRIDDTDSERSKQEYVDGIKADLIWLGLDWDGEECQSARFDLYERRFEELRAQGLVYPCYETAEELDLRRKVLQGRGLPPIYERTALNLSDAERAAKEAEGIRPHWRFKLDHATPIIWTDLVRGEVQFDAKTMSDPVIRRADGSWLYMLPSVIDDIDMGITHVVRGEDHVSNTAAQIQMFTALGATPPIFAHEALLTGSEGKLSKRLGSLGVAHFREEGIEPMAVKALLARIGTSDPVLPATDFAPLIESFDFSRFGRAPARFDEAELATLNQKILHHSDYATVKDRLPADIDAEAWAAIGPNIHKLADVADWWAVVKGPVAAPTLDTDDKAFLGQAATAADALDWSSDPWHALTNALKDGTGRKGKALFLPLRLALTGMEHGPDMTALLPLIGKDEAVQRLKAGSV